MPRRKEKIWEYEALFEPNGAGYTVTVPKLPGLVTEGTTLQGARMMARDAIRCYLEAELKAVSFGPQKQSHKERFAVSIF